MPFVALVLQRPGDVARDLRNGGGGRGNAWQRFWRVRMPLLRPAILIPSSPARCAFRVFDIVYILTAAGGVSNAHDHVSHLSEHLLVRQAGYRRGAVLPDLDGDPRPGFV